MTLLDLASLNDAMRTAYTNAARRMNAKHFDIPIRTGLGLNSREHWRVRAKRVKRERQAVWAAWPWRNFMGWVWPLEVTLTRQKPSGKMLDDDNLRGALKGIRDQIAAELKIDDGSDKVIWKYGQRYGEWGVGVEVWSEGFSR